MIYPYLCPNEACKNDFDVIKSVAEMEQVEACPKCGTISNRYIARTHFYGASDWNTAHYNHAMGKKFSSNKEAAREAKARGLVEVGTQDVERSMAQQEKTREAHIERASKDALSHLEYGLKKELGKI